MDSSALKIMLTEMRKAFPPVNLRSRSVLVNNFLFIYNMIVASADLCCAAWTNSMSVDDNLVVYYHKHLREEREHAVWLLEDLRAAGIEPDMLNCHAIAEQIVGAAYYRIYHVHPVSLLGYSFALEAFPMPIAQVEVLEKLHGTGLIRTLRHHAENDEQHASDLSAMIDSQSLEHQKLIMQSAVRTTLGLRAAATTFGV